MRGGGDPIKIISGILNGSEINNERHKRGK